MGAPADRIGFMQGRLSPLVDGRIQAFPWDCWETEFPAARRLGLSLVEWTLDHDRLHQNPLMTEAGRARIAALTAETGVRVSSVTGDCFMQAPFWKSAGAARAELLADLQAVVRAGAAVGTGVVVVPTVDNGSLASAAEEADLLDGLNACAGLLRATGVRIAIESDFPPERLAAFIARIPQDLCGVNLDIGNSASLGWAPEVEIPTLGRRIVHVHVKDRVLGGTTVPLGEGDADLPAAFRELNAIGYRGLYILQTARAADGEHDKALARYRGLALDLMEAA